MRPNHRATKQQSLSATLYIAAKAPRPGFAKTRLGKAIGPMQAIALYKAFLQDLAARFSTAPFEVVWFITPPTPGARSYHSLRRPGDDGAC